MYRFAQKLIATVVILALGLIPLWLYLGARGIVEPQGFWQNLALTGIGLYLFGGTQMILLVFVGIMLFSLWAHKGPVW